MRDERGNRIGHLVCLFHNTINLFECGIKPVWVFDGPTNGKPGHWPIRYRRITRTMIADAKTLLSLMGCAVI